MTHYGQSVSSKLTPTYASKRGVFGWLLFDWATQPTFTLLTTFIFAPYFAARFVGDVVTGQSYWGYGTAAAGIIIAILSPIMGSIADQTGRRKPWIAAFSIMIVAGGLLLWHAVPWQGEAARPFDSLVLAILGAYVLAIIGAEFATVFTNAMMPSLVPPHRLGRLSGNGWALGYAGGLVSLVVVLGFLVGSSQNGITLLGLTPLFGLDPVQGEGTRATGPLSALWYLMFVLPLFLFTPDTARKKGVSLIGAARGGLKRLAHRIIAARKDKPLFLYLIAHMLYIDGLIALFTFGGIYAKGVFNWDTTKLGLFGIFLTITGVAGALIGGRLNDRFGSLAVINASIVLLIVSSIGILSIAQTSVFFFVPVSTGTAELAYYAIGGLIGAAAGPLQSASRTYLAEITKPEEHTSIFGLYAMSGKVTSFVAPLSIGIVTTLTQSQRIGISILLLFLIAGLVVLKAARNASSA